MVRWALRILALIAMGAAINLAIATALTCTSSLRSDGMSSVAARWDQEHGQWTPADYVMGFTGKGASMSFSPQQHASGLNDAQERAMIAVAARHVPTARRNQPAPSSPNALSTDSARLFEYEHMTITEVRGTGTRLYIVIGMLATTNSVVGEMQNAHEFRAGWPWPAFASSRTYSAAGGYSAWSWSLGMVKAPPDATTLSTSASMLPERPIPAMPLWPGAALNTLVYAAALGLLWGSVGLLTAKFRHREGHCRKCRHLLAGLPAGAPCPECGNAPSEQGTQPTSSLPL